MWYTVENDLNKKSQYQSTMISYGSYIIDNEDDRIELKEAAEISFNALAKMGKVNLFQWKTCMKFVLYWNMMLAI